jgi:hypothetical protein
MNPRPWLTNRWIWCAGLSLAASLLPAQTISTNTLSDAELEGRKWARQLCETQPADNFTNNGVLKIRDAQGNRTEVPLHSEVTATPAGWQVAYFATTAPGQTNILHIQHQIGQPNQYRLTRAPAEGATTLTGNETMTSFGGSDFWVADLGLEFLQWPQQKVVKKEFHDNVASVIIESTNPNPATNAYSRVVSRIAEDSNGVMEATAYDAAGRRLKEFNVKSLKKINGQWQVESVIMENVQTDSRTRLEFELKR